MIKEKLVFLTTNPTNQFAQNSILATHVAPRIAACYLCIGQHAHVHASGTGALVTFVLRLGARKGRVRRYTPRPVYPPKETNSLLIE